MDGVDGILSHENEELRDRVATLEKKVQKQDDEIICLKSALSDCIRRITSLESGKGGSNALLPSKPNFRSATGSRKPKSVSSSHSSLSQDSHKSASQSHRITAKTSHSAHSAPMKKWPSTPQTDVANGQITPRSPVSPKATLPFRRSGSLGSLSRSPTTPTSPSPRGSKEPSFNQDDGYVKFYLRGRALTLWAPTDHGDFDITKKGELPEESLKLEWVYGYRGRDARSNLFLLPTGEIVYFIAAVVVLYNVEEHMQRHYLGHTDDVKCLAVHPDKITIATGQVAGHDRKEGKRRKPQGSDAPNDMMPHIRIWDSVSLNTLHIIGLNDFERAVSCVAFSKADGGQYLIAVDDANEHVISLWDWQKGEKGHKITETKSSTEPVLGAEFHPIDKNVVVTCGKGQLSFWTIEGQTLTKKQGIFEKHDKPKFVTCMAFAENGDLLTGDSNGNLYVWGREEITEGTNRITHASTGAHEGGIFSICVLKDGTLLTGGKDRRIVKWDANYQATGDEHEIPELYGPVRMLSLSKGSMILVGTTRNAILQGSVDLNFKPIVQGHMDEVWGMASHPNQHQFVTCGYDKTLYVWDTLTHSAVWQKELPDGAHCATFHPEGGILVLGTVAARWLVLDLTTHDIISTHTDGSEQIECITFSPDGNSLAIGSRDNYIYVYSVTEGGRKYSRVGKCSGHSSFVTHLDWSSDNQYLQSNSGDYELLYWNASTCKQVTSPTSLRDVEWATQTCTLGFNTCGIWPEGADGTDVNACSRSVNSKMLASADDFGKVNLFKFPSCQPKSNCHSYGGHSSHVTNVSFLHDDSRLMSTGGKDTAILQWQIV